METDIIMLPMYVRKLITEYNIPVIANLLFQVLSAAYQLGCTKEQLKALCLEEERDLMPWNDRKTNRIIGDDDVENHLGDIR